MDKPGYVYILPSKRNGTLYTGVTSELVQRIWQHKQKHADGFTKKHGVDRLVYYEVHGDMYEAITREKRLKKWNRRWKLELIEEMNPTWEDLFDEIAGLSGSPYPFSRAHAFAGMTIWRVTRSRTIRCLR